MFTPSRLLREERGEIIRQWEAAVADRESFANGGKEKCARFELRAKELAQQIDEAERREAEGAEVHRNPSRAAILGNFEDPEPPQTKRDKERREAFRSYLKHGLLPNSYGDRGISADQRELLFEMRDMGTGGQGAYPGATSGFFVPVGFAGQFEAALKYYGGMLQAAKIWDTATGNPIPYPSVDDTTVIGEQVDENAPVSGADVPVSQIMYGAFKYSSKLVKVSIELLQDSAFDLESFLTEQFAIRIGRILNKKFTTGVGTTEPWGIATQATSSGQTVIGDDNASTPDPTRQVGYLDLVNLEHSVDPLYRPGSKFMMHDNTLSSLKKLKDNYGRPLWNSGLADRVPATINGYPYVINNDMATLAQTSPASARKTVLFGPLDKYLIRRVKQMSVLRLVERFAENGQVAFLAFARYDGGTLDAGTHPVRALVSPSS